LQHQNESAVQIAAMHYQSSHLLSTSKQGCHY
jgi:hypothetical protein